jgi:RimJ/RimL family protein N-acetyltransferase
MEFKVGSFAGAREIRKLFKEYKFLPFREYRLNKGKLENFGANKVIHELKQKKAEAVTVRADEGELFGLVTYSKLEWDSTHFGMPMGAVRDVIMSEKLPNLVKIKKGAITLALSELRKKGITHVSTKADIYDITTVHALEMAGFRLMGTTIIYAFDFRRFQIPEFEDQCTLRLAKVEDEDTLIRIAAISFSKTRVSEDRFHSDPDLPEEKSNALYIEWIRNSIEGEIADAIIVAELEGKPVGFTTVENFRARADEVGVNIGALLLSAVLPEARGRGVYTSMIKKGLEYLRPKVGIVELGTQITNFPVQKAWSKLGFKLASGTYAFHRTLQKN